MPGLNLTRDEALARAGVISEVIRYDIELDLTRGDTDFGSRTRVEFTAAPGGAAFADLVSTNVRSIKLNDRDLDPGAHHQDSRISLDDLAEHNVLEVDADCQYMHTGEGLHRFVDPADGKAYTYSQFEVPDARRVYTTFEQPDLKSTFTLTVKAPKGWKVFSNAPTPSPEEDGDSWTYRFATTEKMSTYITAVVAGPYEGVTDTLTSSDGRTIDLGVYCRASVLEHLDADAIIDITRKGFEFFEDAYGIAYPFTKYDQVFVPEYNAGAMENAGCVTFRDAYVFRTRPTEAQLESRANTILHELAHMWFGDLVTMKWWNDLWLNESFAEFMSHLALAENTPYTEGWTGFMVRKDWGLKQDQLPTTHPITAQIRDLADVEVNFDGITYAKGASVLRQLVSYVGRDAFFAGLHEYLTAHSYANATLADLLGELEKASGRDLAAWSKVWLEEAGVTLLRPSVETDEEGRITRLSIEQEAFSEGASLRPHRLAVAGYSLDGESLQRVFHEELDVDGASTDVPSAEGVARPDFILVNDGDLAYAKIRLDEDSLAFAVANITRFTDSLTRGVVMAAAWDMTRDGQMKARDYLNLALTAVPAETNMQLLTLTLRHIDEAVRTFVAPDARAEAAETVGRRLLLLARTARSGSDAQRMLVAAAARNASNAEQFEAIKALYDGSATLEGLELDVDLQWSLLIALVRGGVAGDAEIDAREQEDDTMTGRQNAAAARAARDDAAVKEQVWEQVLGDKSIPNDTRWAMVSGFWAQARTTPSLYEPYVERYFAALAQVWEENTFHTAEDLTTLLFPSDLAGYAPGVDVVRAGHEWIDANPGAPAGAVRIIRERIDVCERQMANQVADA
ncbi:aminopeptidase N [Pauljensenia hongkongensis]|uniref:Aminopeptidase N n=1 Tax=Pauljensenia hongkongensis TaxID=178339 RepID=A0A1D8B0S8_9ACTO|nr:aminopeptidase N [Pauljensenia hongkongensis]AOS46740.1 aminopeptidase N [Pauljensenia hongkongensis]EFW10675.1 aminopeptidase N [Actinomyces sp. oral taxon 178 str. F0338]